jgi:hypothetical protein
MSNLFDTNARADEAVFGGEPAARAVGLPTPRDLPGTFAPGGSNQTAQNLVSSMEADTQRMMAGLNASRPAREPVQGYNPETNEVFSGGKTFQLDLNEGRQNAQLFDIDNPQLPQGFVPIRSSEFKKKLASEYEGLDIIDDSQRAFGQMASGIGSALRDVGADSVGPALEQFGGDIARRNPSKIGSVQDIIDSPLVTAGEAVGETGFEVARYGALGATGAAVGAGIGVGLTAATGGLAAPTIPVFAFLGNRVANWIPTFAQTYGGIRSEQREAGIENKDRAAAAAFGSSALDFLLGPEIRVMRAVGGPLTRAATAKVDNIAQARAFLAQGAPRATGSYGRNAAVDLGGEFVTEVAQTGLERYGAEKDLTSEEALNEYGVAGIKGGIGGAALSPVGTAAENRRQIAEQMPAYQQAKNFVENLRADMELAADPAAPSAARMQAAKRAQDVLRGSSDDPEFDAVLQEFKQKLSFVDTQIVAGATREALDTNAPVNLMETRPAFFDRGAEQVQTTQPSDLSAYEAPAPMGREPRAPQQVDTGAPVQQVETMQPMGPTITPGQRVVAGFPELNATMDQIQSGQIAREGLPVTGELTPGQQAALTPPTPLDPIQQVLRGVSLDLGAPASTPAPTVTTPAPAPAPLQQVETRPVPVVSEVPGADVPGVSPAAAPAVAGLSEPDAPLSGEENKAMLRLIDEANDATDTGRTLPASVQGDARITAPGKVSMSTAALARIRDALIKGKEAKGDKEQRIVAALRNFASAYKSYLDIGGEARIGAGSTVKGERIRRGGSAAQTQAVADAAALVRRELEAVGVAVGGNAKDVEAIVRLVKTMAQGKIAVPGRTRESVIKGMGSFDAILSSAWNAAKRETFLGDTTDRADVRGQPIRAARERVGARSPIEVAVVDGYLSLGDQKIIEGETNRKRKAMEKDGAKETDIKKAVAEIRDRRTAELKAKRKGIGAALQYIIDAGTPFERTIATALRDTLDNQESDVTVVFIDSGTPSFDPATNTITLRREESPEVILHETLHAALQSFVYNNPNNPAVKQLKASVKAVVGYKGALGEKAKAVQDLLKKLVAGGNELDAVLELVSYGTTLNEFRRAMQAMPSKGTPKSFYESVSNVWNYIRDILSGLLGVKDTVANDVLDASVMLLERAGKSTPTRNKGGRLDAAVTSSDPEPASEPTTVAKGTDEQAAKSAGYPSFDAYASQPSSKYNITRMFFERIGFGVDKDGNYNAAGRKTQELASKASLLIRRNFPMLERIILNINSKFGLPPAMQRIMEYFKSNQNTGILEMEKLTEYVHRNPAVARPMLDYLDGDTKALDGVKDATAIRAIADNVRMHLETYINDLPANSPERALFQNLKFTEYLLHPKSVAQLANKSFGLKKLSTLLTIKRREETNIDAFKQMLPMKDGVVDSEAPLYQTFETVQDNDGVNQRVPMGFIDKKLADTNPPAGLDIDKTRVWKMTGRKGDRYSFVSRAVTPGEVRRMAEDGRVEELSATLLNTMAALSHNYASRNFFAGLMPLGREDGEPTAMSVVFDSEEQLRKIFKGGVPNEIIDAGDDAIDMQSIKKDLQRTGTWVRLPEGPTYGALAGKIISGPAWSAMRDMHDRAPLLNSQALATTMSWFKKAKTGYTPATHANNILTNYAMTLLHGISHKTLRDAALMFAKFEGAPGRLSPKELAIMQAFYRSGAVLGQYTQTEAKQTIAKALSDSITPDSGDSLLTKLAQMAKFEKEFAKRVEQAGRFGRNADARIMEFYAAGDNIFRLAAFMNVAGNLQARDDTKELSPAQTTEAGIAARKMFLDYDIDARWVRTARQSVLPFVSWSYAIMPVLGRLAITRPWAMVNMLTAIAVMNSIMDDEDDEEWRKKGPEAVRDKALWGMGPHMYMRVPFLGDDQNPVYWNIGKSIPMMALFQPPAGESKLLGQGWYPGFLNPSGPYVSLLANTFLNIDPFTGKELYKETDTSTDKLLNSGAAVWDVMMPSWASTRLYNNFKDLADDKVGPTGVLPDSMFIARFFGMTLYEFNRSEVQYSQNAEVSKLKREFMTAMRAAAKDEARRGYPDYEALDVKLADLRERMMQAMDKARGEE